MVRSTVLQDEVKELNNTKADPRLTADLFASTWWDCSFIPHRSQFLGLCGNTLSSDHIASQTKIMDYLQHSIKDWKHICGVFQQLSLLSPTQKEL